MKLNYSTAQSSSSLGTSATKVWVTNGSRIGIQIHASSLNGSNLLVTSVAAGSGTPTMTQATAMYELSPGQTISTDDGRFDYQQDVYVCMVAGTGTYNAYEVLYS